MTQSLLEADHVSVGELMGSLRASLSGANTSETFDLLDALWARLAVHIRAEHLCLFPAILEARSELLTGQDGRPTRSEAVAAIQRLRDDHDFFMHQLAVAVKTMRVVLSGHEGQDDHVNIGAVRQIVEAVALRLDQHNRLEEEQIYAWASVLLSNDEQMQLALAERRELENLPARFRDPGE